MAAGYQRKFPEGTQQITTGCQYCAVGCGYSAILVPILFSSNVHVAEDLNNAVMPPELKTDFDEHGIILSSNLSISVDHKGVKWTIEDATHNSRYVIKLNSRIEKLQVLGEPQLPLGGVSSFITPAMCNTIKFKGKMYEVAVAPDVRCDLNKGNFSVRGGSQGENLVRSDGNNRSTKDRLKSPAVRLSNGEWIEITWDVLYQVMAKLLTATTEMGVDTTDGKTQIIVQRPHALGVKLFEHQFLENTFAATKLFYSMFGTPNVAYHDRPSTAGSSPGLKDVGFRPHDYSYQEVLESDVLVFVGTNPYENQSVFFMQYCVGKEFIVIDPRKSATAQYAEETGGLHLQPTKLGADSIVLYAICREIIKRWNTHQPNHPFPWSDRIVSNNDVQTLRTSIGQLSGKKKYETMRRASRAMTFKQFEGFLGVAESDQTAQYSLGQAAEVSGVPEHLLRETISRMFDPNETDKDRQPRIGIFYEKGMIWGFNYHNTAAVACLGLLLGAYTKDGGRFVGRVGGHQKGWAAAMADLRDLVDNKTGSQSEEPFSLGYPYHNVVDRYRDDHLSKEIRVPHNLDNHVFGPDEDQIKSRSDNLATLSNGLITHAQPDVRLLWIIGGNYLGQTNNSEWKQKELQRRTTIGNTTGVPLRPDPPPVGGSLTVEQIFAVFKRRIEAVDAQGIPGLVIVHQDIFPNPTTTLSDIRIPAAGWGEDTFCRYNAQRRLRVYDKFQDPPLCPKDVMSVQGDPETVVDNSAIYQHSPKSDWRIFRDIARRLGREMDKKLPSGDGQFEKKLSTGHFFFWRHSGEVADDMAGHSNRTVGMGLQALLQFGKGNESVDDSRLLHSILGAGQTNGISPNLSDIYTVAEEAENPIHGNGIATNGLMLPVTNEGGRLVGHLRYPRNYLDGKLMFIKAPWSEIETVFNEINSSNPTTLNPNELLITNGRFNHLWNNLYHHLRNDYVNQRYPEDLPGPVLEVNPSWAASQPGGGIKNGDVVEVQRGDAGPGFMAIASLQDSVPAHLAFALFSYPVRIEEDGPTTGTKKKYFTFDGYVNRITHGYTDGINPIAALKYGRAKITPTGKKYVPSPSGEGENFTGPTYESRNVITSSNFGFLFEFLDEDGSLSQRLDEGNVPSKIHTAFTDHPDLPSPVNPQIFIQHPGRRWHLSWETDPAGLTVHSFVLESQSETDSLGEVQLKIVASSARWNQYGRFKEKTRINWEMRELIVTKGLPRTFAPDDIGIPHPEATQELLLRPDIFLEKLVEDGNLRRRFDRALKRDRMNYFDQGRIVDSWKNNGWTSQEFLIAEKFLDQFP